MDTDYRTKYAVVLELGDMGLTVPPSPANPPLKVSLTHTHYSPHSDISSVFCYLMLSKDPTLSFIAT
jgi:hypothetical protein